MPPALHNLLTLLLIFTPLTLSAPLFGINFGGSSNNAATSPVSQSTITSQLLRPAQFARAVYCPTESVQSFSCGAACDAVKGIKVLQGGGDEGATPRFLIATDPSSKAVVVAHQGTDPQNVLSLLNDAEFLPVGLDLKRFPKAASGAKVHSGFQDTQARTSDLVLSTVKSALASSGFTRVYTTGHSLGAALATLDALMLKMNLPSNIEIDSVVFGLPRVGNQNFANMVDSLFPTFTHVTNQHDPVPNLPPELLGFQHPSGEVHITSVSGDSASVVSCPGQENKACSDGNSLFQVSIPNHLGPYFSGISFGEDQCT